MVRIRILAPATLSCLDSFPTSYLIDRSGKIVTVHVGFDEGDETKYEKQISELLKTR